MTAKAYVLIEAQVGKTKQVVEAIRKLQGVVSVDIVTGPYDAIAVIQGKTLNDIGDLVTAKINPTRGVSRTVTCLVFKGP
jgi:DNA-binding Lrp family transcriptional regulator